MKLSQVRGALLEEIIIKLLSNVGYDVITSAGEGIRMGRSGLEVCGRGEWHQIDALASLKYTPAFMYPLRLLLEAKCYKRNRPVGIDVPRNSVGVIKDIQENYFTYLAGQEELQVQRFNYNSAIFSTSNYTIGAQRYSIAHQIFLITYEHVPLMQPIAEKLLDLEGANFINFEEIESLKMISNEFVDLLNEMRIESRIFSESGLEMIAEIKNRLEQINGSYFGMLQGRYPLHLISERTLPPGLFIESDELECKVTSTDLKSWKFSPSHILPDSDEYFELEFNLPREIAQIVNGLNDRNEIANIKRQRFSYIDISGEVGGIQRMLKLKLDENWLNNFLLDD